MKHLLVVGLLSCASIGNAQTYGNMPFATPQISNPSFMALNKLPTLNVYGKVGRYFNSQYLGYSQYSEKLKGTWGIYYNGFNAKVSDQYQSNGNRMGVSYARLFKINENWNYSLGAGIGLSGRGINYQGESFFDFDLGVNVGGTLYGKNLFTSLNFGYSVNGVGQLEWRTGYKFTPIKNLDFSITPIITFNSQFGHLSTNANVNIGYKKLNLNFGYSNGGGNIGLGYDFNRFRLNYSVGNINLPHSSNVYHELGIQIKLGKKGQEKRDTKFNHRLF